MTSPSTHHGIIVGTDGSPYSTVAIEWAANDALLRGIPLTVVYVLPPYDAGLWLDIPVPGEFLEARNVRGDEITAEGMRIARDATGDKIAVSTHTVEGNAVSALVDLSKDADMIVIGCRGLGAISRTLLGSVSSGLLHHAHCPVAVVHEERHHGGPVVVGIDGSNASEAAVAIAFDEASRRGVGLTALHTYTDAVADEGFAYANWTMVVEQAQESLAERLAGWQEQYPDVQVSRVVSRDWPSHQLLELSKTAQLVVLGSHGRGGFAGLLLGSVSSAVAQSAEVPVIVARSA